MATSSKGTSSKGTSSKGTSTPSKSASAKSIASIVSKAKAAGKSNSQIQSAFKSVFGGGGSSGSSTTPTAKTTTTTPATGTTTTPPAKTTTTTPPAKSLPQGASTTVNAALAAGQTPAQISQKLIAGGYNPSQVNNLIGTMAKQKTQATNQSTQVNTQSTSTLSPDAQQFAKDNPGFANPYANDGTSDIAMAGNVAPKKETTNLALDSGEDKTTEEKVSDLVVGTPYTQANIDTVRDERDSMQNIVKDEVSTQLGQLQGLSNNLAQRNSNVAGIMRNRVNLAQDTFGQIDGRIKEMENLSRQAFDQGTANMIRAKVMDMAKQGIIGNDQMDVVANIELSKINNEAQLKKIELERDLQAQYSDLLKEKQSVLDGIMQDQSMNENEKMNYATQITAAYNAVSNNYINTMNNISNTYSQGTQNILSPFSAVEAGANQAITAKDVETKIQNMDYQKAFAGPLERMNFIRDYINNSNSTLAPAAMQILASEINKPDFSTRRDLPNQIAQIMQKAAAKAKASNTTQADGWGQVINTSDDKRYSI